jgi:predicted lipid-binding transport protein (Tim44 family)
MTITLTTMPLVRRLVPSLLVVMLVPAGLIAGCGPGDPAGSVKGGGSGLPPTTWAKSVCTALSPWRTRINTLTDSAQVQLTSATTPAQAKQNLVGLLSGAETASETARRQIAEAGTPDVDRGAEIAARFVASLQAARDAYAHAHGTVAGLDAGNPSAFYAAVAAAFEKLQQEYAASALDTDKLSSAPLREAFNEVPECR